MINSGKGWTKHPRISFLIITMLSCAFADEDKLEQQPEMIPLYPKQTFGDLRKETKAPPGMIMAIREEGHWRFKILVRTNGWNASSSIDKIVLRGEGFKIPVSHAGAVSISNLDKSFINITLSDHMAKSAILELWSSYAGRGGNHAIHYTIKLSDLTK